MPIQDTPVSQLLLERTSAEPAQYALLAVVIALVFYLFYAVINPDRF
jgi:K+-transporting ATPase KdpF subunit